MSSVQSAGNGKDDFYVRFWGVRGSISTSGEDTIRYGGNTSSLEIRCGDHLLMFDAGSGIRELGQHLMQVNGPVEADLFLTHAHYDHLCGVPFFTPFYIPTSQVKIWSGCLKPARDPHAVLCELMRGPLFPVPPSVFQAEIDYHQFKTGTELKPKDGVVVRTGALNHPNGATGYRVEFQGKSICYITDTEHLKDGVDKAVVELVEGADIVIYDAMYTDDEYERCAGFGHSTWREGVELCNAANVKTFVAFHHEPGHTDDDMDRIAEDIDVARPGSVVSKEGMILRP